MDYGLFPKASDHETAAEIGWLLYSTQSQDEERLSELISELVQEKVGTKWRPIRVNDRYKKDTSDASNRTYALHLEASTEKGALIRQRLSKWYGTGRSDFPDGTKMRLVPPFQTIISYTHKGKYASLVFRQAALSARLCTGSTWEVTSHYVLDRPDPATGGTLRCIKMSIPLAVFPSTPLFHSVDRMWRSTNGVTFSFLPENETDTRSVIAGLIPFIKEMHSQWYLQFFSEGAKLCHDTSKWDVKTRSAYSAEEAESDGFLAEDDEMNKMDNVPGYRTQSMLSIAIHRPRVSNMGEFPSMYKDSDSVSTFNTKKANSVHTSTVFTP